MKRFGYVWVGVVVLVVCAGLTFAGENTIKEECVAKSKAAAKMIKEQGLEAALGKINDKKGPFVSKKTYVFCMSQDTGAMLGHPYLPKRVLGMNINEVVDINGKKYMLEILKTARAQGQGWVDYAFRLKNKNSFVMQVPGANVIVGAGYYDGKTFPAPQFSVSETPVHSVPGKKAAVIVAFKNFEDNEFNLPMELFRRAGVETTVFSTKKGVAKGMYGTEVNVMKQLEELNVADFDAVVFVGGRGAFALHDNPQAHAVAREAAQKEKVLSAICWAPVILANAGVLNGKNVTVNPFEAEPFRKKGLAYTGKDVSVDGKIVTANGPKASEAFGRAILAALK